MFHNRIASDLRKHFSTVGPSPTHAAPSASATPDVLGTAARLVLLPAITPASLEPHSAAARDRSNLLQEFVRVSSHRVAAFLAEAAVLVLVLGILDRFLASNRIDLHWVGGAFLISTILLAASVALELSARLWLARTGQV